MTNIDAIILGVVEGLTEFLPISSTGHMSIVSQFLGILHNPETIIFEIVIQLGAILAVVCFYWRKFFDFKLMLKIFVAFLPTGLVGFSLYKIIKSLLASEFIIAYSLILGGIALIIVEKIYKIQYEQKKIQHEEIDYTNAFLLGCAQCLAMIPGVSRSGAVITSGLIMNIKRNVLVDFTFLLAVPTMLAATLFTLYKSQDLLTSEYFYNLSIGFLVSFTVALLVIKFLLNYIKKFDFIPFGIYRIIFGIFILITLTNL